MHVRRALALTVLAPLLLAGCSDGDPEAEPTPKMPDSSSSTPTPTESESPEVESAEDFIRRWQATADAMVTTGNAKEFLRMSPGCQACATYAEQVTDVYEKSGKVTFSGSEVVEVKEDAPSPPTFVVEVRAARLSIEVPGEDPRVFPAATQRYRMTLERKGGTFVMRQYSVI